MFFRIWPALTFATLAAACVAPTNNDFVFLGESNVSGEEATQEANLIVRNSNAAGCHGVSVGGYATTILLEGGQLVYGVPVMVSCPAGVILLPNGAPQP